MRLLATAFCLAAVIAQAASSPEAAFEVGRKAWASKNYDAALANFEMALTAEPDNLRYGSDYRQAVIEQAKAAHPKEGSPADFDRAVKFFESLTASHPSAANAFLNFGFSYVDKIPAAGSITQVLLANNALTQFTKSISTKPTWIGLYTRGNSYLYWPKIFGRAQMGVNDLEAAYKMQSGQPLKSFHVRVYISLGDAYWKTDQIEKATAIWREGSKKFPDSKPLKERLAKEGDGLRAYIEDVLDPNKRVDTDLREVWAN